MLEVCPSAMVSMDIEQLINEAVQLNGAVSLLKRLSQQ